MNRGMPYLTDFLRDPKIREMMATGDCIVHGPQSETIRRERETNTGDCIVHGPQSETIRRERETNTGITEAEFTQQVIEYAQLCGWMVAHFRPGMNRRGEWQTAVAGDGVGFPDLLMIRESVVVAELKVGKNKPSAEQAVWLERFKVAQCRSFVWTPDSWEQIRRVLS